jgi:hypothetical protein
MIDRANIMVVVFEGRGTNAKLKRWVSGFANRRLATPPTGLKDFIGLWRNQEVKNFLENTKLEWLLILDDDMVPVPDTDLLLDCTADIAGASYWSKEGGVAHGKDGCVGCGALKVSRKALLAVQPPWFMIEMDGTGTKLASCECVYFCRKMKAAGFQPVHAGRMGHMMMLEVLPSPDGKMPQVRFPKI